MQSHRGLGFNIKLVGGTVKSVTDIFAICSSFMHLANLY